MSGVFHGGGVAEAAAFYGRSADEWLDLSTGINPCPPPIPELQPSLWQRLPDKDVSIAARLAAAKYYGSGGILPIAAAGTQPLIRLLAGLAERAKRVAILAPTYGEYRAVFERAGFAVDDIADFDALSEAHGTVIVVNPNNPDGRTYSHGDLRALSLQMAAREAMLIVDEAFGDLVPDVSLAADVAHNPHLVVLRSFGKFFGLAGLRLSFAIAGKAYASALEEGLGPWPVSGPALSIATNLMSGDMATIRDGIATRHAALCNVLSKNGLKIVGGTDLFVLVSVPNAADFHAHLCRHAILTRKFSYRDDWLRIGLCADDGELQRLSAALQDWEAS
jgi:cobalamin biosynthesis protein CobC